MSDYGNLLEENIRLKAEIERLKAEVAAAKKPVAGAGLGSQAAQANIQNYISGQTSANTGYNLTSGYVAPRVSDTE